MGALSAAAELHTASAAAGGGSVQGDKAFELQGDVLPTVGKALSSLTRESQACKQALLGDSTPWGKQVGSLALFYSNHGIGMLGAHARVVWDDGFTALPQEVRTSACLLAASSLPARVSDARELQRLRCLRLTIVCICRRTAHGTGQVAMAISQKRLWLMGRRAHPKLRRGYGSKSALERSSTPYRKP